MTEAPYSLPWLLPGSVIVLAVATAFASRVGRILGARWQVAWLLLSSIGVILVATLTPVARDTAPPVGAIAATCDFTRVGFPSIEQLLGPGEIVENILLFVPLGAAIALLPPGRIRRGVGVFAIAMPFAIEAFQLVATPLSRACQAGDVTDNLTGLAIGFAIGLIVGRLIPSLRAGGPGPVGR